jgi:hypothetical protein
MEKLRKSLKYIQTGLIINLYTALCFYNIAVAAGFLYQL